MDWIDGQTRLEAFTLRSPDPAIDAWLLGAQRPPEVGSFYYGLVPERFWKFIDFDPLTGCWVWNGARRREYATFYLPVKGNTHGRLVIGHRYSHENLIAEIADGLDADHLCLNKPCVNPAHTEPVTEQINTLRGNPFIRNFALATHCANGHEWNEINTHTRYVTRSDGSKVPARACRACARENRRRYSKEKNANAAMA